MFTLADAAQPLFSTIGKDAAGAGDFAPTDVEKEAVAHALNQAMQGMVQYAKPSVFAQEKRIRIRPPETVELETDRRGKITSVDVSAATAWSATHVQSTGGYLQFVFSTDVSLDPGDRVIVSSGSSTYQGYHNVTAIESNAAGTIATITTATPSTVTSTANAATVKRALKSWMRGCSITGSGFDAEADDITTINNRLSRDLTKLLDEEDTHYPFGGVDVKVVHDRYLLDENVRGILTDPAKRIIDGATSAPIWVDKDGQDGAPRLYLRWNPLDDGDPVQFLRFWYYSTPRAIKTTELDSAAASWTAEFPLQAPASFHQTWLIPIASQHLVQRMQFSADEAQSQEGILAEIYREYQEAVRRLEEFDTATYPDSLQKALV